jgi:hypothetical protein
MATWDEIYKVLFPALGDQAYRPVPVSALPDPTVQPFPATGDGEIDAALLGATKTPNWVELGRQLRQLSLGRGFGGMAVRRDKHDLEVVFVRAYGPLLTLEAAEVDVQHFWTIAKKLGGMIDHFKLSPETKQLMTDVFSKHAESHTPPPENGGEQKPKPADTGWDISQADIEEIRKAGGGAEANGGVVIKVALAILHFFWDVADTDAATAVDLLVGTQGLDKKLVDRLESVYGLAESQPRLGWANTLSGVGIDCPKVEVHGHTMNGSLDLGDLGRSIKWYLANGVGG